MIAEESSCRSSIPRRRGVIYTPGPEHAQARGKDRVAMSKGKEDSPAQVTSHMPHKVPVVYWIFSRLSHHSCSQRLGTMERGLTARLPGHVLAMHICLGCSPGAARLFARPQSLQAREAHGYVYGNAQRQVSLGMVSYLLQSRPGTYATRISKRGLGLLGNVVRLVQVKPALEGGGDISGLDALAGIRGKL